MTEARTAAWKDIVAVTEKFCSSLAPHMSNIEQASLTCAPAPRLQLSIFDKSSIIPALKDFGISDTVTTAILHLLDSHVQRLAIIYQRSWEGLHASHSLPRDQSYIERLQLTFCAKFTRDALSIKEAVFNILKEARKRFSIDAETSAQSDMESSSEEGLVARGHSRLAVTILEKAYARTTNITRAEKIRLATATKLKPRQVTIWFQNRRNRKTAKNTYKYKRETSPHSSTSFKKRKAEGLYDGEARHPSQRMRSSTPENPPDMSRDVYLSRFSSSSSSISSVDSLASFFGGRNSNSGYTYSTDSSLADDECALKRQYKIAQTPIFSSFDDQLKLQGLSSSPQHDAADVDPANAMIFSDEGVLQLDFDDLDLDLESIASDLPSFNLKDFDFVIPTLTSPGGNTTKQNLSKNGTSCSFAVPNVPTSPYDAAALLNSFIFSTNEAVTQAQQKEGWSLGESSVIEQACSQDDLSWFLNLQGLSPGSAASPSGQSNAIEIVSNDSNEAAASSQDFFNFSHEGLFLENIFEQNLESFNISEDQSSSSKSSPFDFLLDTNAANSCPMDDAMKTAVPKRTIFE